MASLSLPTWTTASAHLRWEFIKERFKKKETTHSIKKKIKIQVKKKGRNHAFDQEKIQEGNIIRKLFKFLIDITKYSIWSNWANRQKLST